MNSIELGKFIANLRNEKKLTQEELAEELFIDKRKVSRWECGMSIPDFDMLVKLSEILDVSLYELSICQRIEKEKLTRKVINKFKGIKDFKKYKLKKKLKIILGILLGIFCLFACIYTIKYYDTVAIYRIKSGDDNYQLNGTLILTNKDIIYNINKMSFQNKHLFYDTNINNCEIGIYTENDKRVIDYAKYNTTTKTIYDINALSENRTYNLINNLIKNNQLSLNITCNKNTNSEQKYSIKLSFTKIYDNKLF